MNKLERAASIVVTQCLKIKRTESVLVISDEPQRDIGHLLWTAALKATDNASLVEIKFSRSRVAEPPDAVAQFMSLVDVLIIATSRSLSHTPARRKACKKGTRVVTMPGITQDTLRRAIDIDYRDTARRSRKIADILTIGRNVHLTSPAGTDVFFSIDGKKGHSDTGLVHEPGAFSNLPAGEASVGPVAGKTNGKIVFERGMADLAKKDDFITFDVRDGYVARIKGNDGGVQLRRLLKYFGRPARNIAELGVGTNPKAKIVGLTLEDEKVLGTVHVAIGNNRSFGGTVDVPIHLDGIILKPTLTIDGKVIIDNGQVMV